MALHVSPLNKTLVHAPSTLTLITATFSSLAFFCHTSTLTSLWNSGAKTIHLSCCSEHVTQLFKSHLDFSGSHIQH